MDQVHKPMMQFRRIRFQVLFSLLFFFVGATAAAQQSTVDSIRGEIAALNPQEPDYLQRKAGAIGTLLQSMKYSDPAQSLLLCDTLAEAFMQIPDTLKAYEAKYRYKAGIYDLQSQYDSMLLNLESYAEALTAIHKSDGYVYLDIGNVYFGFGMFGLASENYDRAEEIFRTEHNLQGLCTIYNNHAQMNMQEQGESDSALMWLRKSYYLRSEQLKDPLLSHESLYLMAAVYRRSGAYDSAKVLLWQVIADITSGAVDKHTDHIALRQEFSGAYTALGLIYTAEKNTDSAEYYFREGEKLYLASDYSNRLPGLYNAWCRLYMQQGNATLSWTFLKKSEAASSLSNPSEAMSLYQLFADWYEWKGMTAEMNEYRLKYYKISDSLQASGNKEQTMVVASRVLQLQDKARIEQQKAEIAEQDLAAVQAARGRIRLIIILIALLLLALLSAWSSRQLRKKNALIEQYNRDLQSANATKEQFLSVISHDLRGPFNALIGMSDLLRHNAQTKNYLNVEQNAEQINEASRKAFVLLDNLMQWVSIQKDNITVRKEVILFSDALDEVLFLLQEQAITRNMTIEKHNDNVKFASDKTLLQVILRNLLSNAIKYTPSGGKIVVSTRVSENSLDIRVEDNGKGFPEGEIEVMMNSSQGISVAKKGGGLGLVLVRQFVELLAGNIVAENLPEGGARVTVTLPVSAEEEKQISKRNEEKIASELLPEEKKMLSPLLKSLEDYEIFDATEIRLLVEDPIRNETANVTQWRKNLLQAVYLADENKYNNLINVATEHAGV